MAIRMQISELLISAHDLGCDKENESTRIRVAEEAVAAAD
jgi:hypothetical protein